jgi:DNA-binding NtrC family response regulator
VLKIIIDGSEESSGHIGGVHVALTDNSNVSRYGFAHLLDDGGEMRSMGALEEEVIRFAIDHYRGRMSEVARRLGIGRSTLYRKIKDYGIAFGGERLTC